MQTVKPPKNQENLDKHVELITFVKQQKQVWLDREFKGDMPPYLIIEKDKTILFSLVGSEVDKERALWAAMICKRAFDMDTLYLIVDARCKFAKKEDLDLENYEPGSLTKLSDAECKQMEVMDCLVAHKATNKEVLVITMPYEYRDSRGQINWLEDKFLFIENEDVSGVIPKYLSKIMNSKPILENDVISNVASTYGLSKKEAIRSCRKAALYSLSNREFTIIGLDKSVIEEE